MLDAGTGQESLLWLSQLPTRAWTAITFEEARARGLRQRIPLREQDRLLVDDWRNPDLLRGESFEVVVADYLLGSCERYAPHFQEQLLGRLCQLSSKWLYIIGQEPQETPTDVVAHWFERMGRWRDALLLLEGRRPHREIPESWVTRQLQNSSLQLAWSERFQNLYDGENLERELGAMESNLQSWSDRGLAQVLRRQVQQLRREGQELLRAEGGVLAWGWDYLLAFSVAPPVGADRPHG